MILRSDEWYLIDPQIRQLTSDVGGARPGLDLTRVLSYLDVGEQGFAMDLLVRLVLSYRPRLTPATRDLFADVLSRMGPVEGTGLPYLSAPAAIADLVDIAGEPARHRGLPPMRGGHMAGSSRTGATIFPPSWTVHRINDAADAVLHGTRPTVPLANGRLWRSGSVDGVPVGVLTTGDGIVRAVLPVLPSGATKPAPAFADPSRPTVAELLSQCVLRNGSRVVGALTDALPDEEREVLRQLAVAAECDELADAVAAWSAAEPASVPDRARTAVRALLDGFDLPVEGCPRIAERAVLTARW